MSERDLHGRASVDAGSVLTSRKQLGQQKCFLRGSDVPTAKLCDRMLRLRWGGLLLHLSTDIGRHTEEFNRILALPARHAVERPEHLDSIRIRDEDS